MTGLSVRALAQSARDGGYAALAADLFGDLDMQEAASAHIRIEGDLATGLRWRETTAVLEELSRGRHPVGVVCGAGFEDRPDLLDRLSRRWPVIGNSAAATARVKDPRSLAEMCKALGVPHPRWRATRPPDGGWLSKRAGGAGGAHVGAGCADGAYWQERVSGEPVSALVLGDGSRAATLGLSRQWADPLPAAPHRYGGAVRPAGLAKPLEEALAGAGAGLVAATGLVGLNSVDFLVSPDGWTLIEINPRPGATLDIFRPDAGSLVALHVAACGGALPDRLPRFAGADAAAVVYARRPVESAPEIAWPDWTADRQPPGTRIAAGAPICTVLARCDGAAEAETLVRHRAAAIRSMLDAG